MQWLSCGSARLSKSIGMIYTAMLEKVREEWRSAAASSGQHWGPILQKPRLAKCQKHHHCFTFSLTLLFSVSSPIRIFESTLTHGGGHFLLYIVTDPSSVKIHTGEKSNHGGGQFLLYIVTSPKTNPSSTSKRASSVLFYLCFTFNDHSSAEAWFTT